MSEAQTIQWFPGHMTKTRRKIQASLKLVDAVAEIIDARIPVSSRNPELHKIIENKMCIRDRHRWHETRPPRWRASPSLSVRCV